MYNDRNTKKTCGNERWKAHIPSFAKNYIRKDVENVYRSFDNAR
jgi:hypothetical protein